jgi:7,8-dihydropterin-6-yl-methyl-4-(beta-D-ribofuranosyl)aminobenzene 5'-phosphate synthase
MRVEIVAQGSTREERLRGEWGLSVLVDDDVLFDTFADPGTIGRYFREHQVDATAIKHIVISHDHWDHTGGLWCVLERNRTAAVYVCRGVSEDLKNKIRGFGNRLVEVTGPLKIRDDVYTTGEIAGTYAGQSIAEQSLVVAPGGKTALITGCSHPGILIILDTVARTHGRELDLVLGGFHLPGTTDDDLETIAERLRDGHNVKILAPCHCTGAEAVDFFEKRLPERLKRVRAGDAFLFNAARSAWELTRAGGE